MTTGRFARSGARTRTMRASEVRGSDPETVEHLLRTIDWSAIEAPWDQVAPRILPILGRVRHAFPLSAEAVHVTVPPSIRVGFGIDLGPAFSHVTAPMLDTWEVELATLLATSLDNLALRLVSEPPVIQRFRQDGTDLIAIQGQGWGSSLVLLPDALAPILGRSPRVLLAPVRNTLIALPEDAEMELAVGIWHALADGAPDELDVDPLRWNGTTVVAIGERGHGRPH